MGTARLAMMGVLAIAIVLNTVQFLGIDEVAPDNYEAISRKPSSDIIEIAQRNAAVDRAYGLSWAISEQQPGANVLLSADDDDAFVVLRFLTLGFGKAATVSLASDSLADVTSLEGLLADPAVSSVETFLGDGHGHRLEEWFYVRGECADDAAPELAMGHLPLDTERAAASESDTGLAFVVVDSCLVPNGGLSE